MFVFRPVSRTITKNFAYVFGGNYDAALGSTTQSFDGSVVASVYSTLTPSYGASASTKSNTTYLFGGGTTTTGASTNIRAFDGTTMTTASGTLPSSIRDTSSASDGVYCFIFGGSGSGSSPTYFSSIQRYSGSSISTDASSLATAVNNTAACSLIMVGQMFVFGGFSGTSRQNIIQRYDGFTRSTDSTTMSVGLSEMTCNTIDSFIFVFPGASDSNSSTTPIYRYDWGSSYASVASAYNGISTANQSSTNAGSQIYVFGGSASSTIIWRYTGSGSVTLASATLPNTHFNGCATPSTVSTNLTV